MITLNDSNLMLVVEIRESKVSLAQMRILHQHRICYTINQQYFTHTGMVVRSVSGPELSLRFNTIYLRGGDTDNNLDWCYCQGRFENINNILITLRTAINEVTKNINYDIIVTKCPTDSDVRKYAFYR